MILNYVFYLANKMGLHFLVCILSLKCPSSSTEFSVVFLFICHNIWFPSALSLIIHTPITCASYPQRADLLLLLSLHYCRLDSTNIVASIVSINCRLGHSCQAVLLSFNPFYPLRLHNMRLRLAVLPSFHDVSPPDLCCCCMSSSVEGSRPPTRILLDRWSLHSSINNSSMASSSSSCVSLHLATVLGARQPPVHLLPWLSCNCCHSQM